MSLTLQNLLTSSPSRISFYVKKPHFENPLLFSLYSPFSHFKKPQHLRFKSQSPYKSAYTHHSPLRAFEFDSGTILDKREGIGNNFEFDAFLSMAEFLCLASSAVISFGLILNSQKPILAWLGNKVSVLQFVLLLGGMVIGATIRRRQWRRICMDYSKPGCSGVNLGDRIEKLEEDVRSSATVIRVMSRQLEKLGIRFRVTRKTLKEPIAETAALCQKNSEATRALAVQEDILEKELGEIQKVLLAMQIQPCGKLDMDAKSRLISVSLSKISAAFLEEAVFLLGEDGDEHIENAVPPHSDEKAVSCSLQNDSEEIAMIGLDAMLLANSTLEDFCRSYFMFHEMDANKPQSIFRYLPLLSFTESYIYQLDNLNEKLLQLPTSRNPVLDKQTDLEENWSWIPKFTELFKTDPFRPLVLLLERRGLLTQRIKEEFECGEQYWTAERKLCYALINKLEISIEDVMRAIHLKSFDYRVLNLLLYQLRGEKVNDMHMEFLSISEFLVEVSDDLFDYEDDVLENSFNILRMFVRIYGAATAPTMLAKSISEAEEKYIHLLKALDPKLSMNYQRRCEEAACEGGKKLGPPLGTWNIPPVIEDEDLYRSERLNYKPLVSTQCCTTSNE